MGGIVGLGHSSVKTDRSNQLAGVNGLWNVFNTSLPMAAPNATAGTQNTNQGLTDLNLAGNFWKDILSGNRQQTLEASAPTLNMINQADDANRKQLAEFGTSRGGGVNAANQTAQTTKMQGIDQTLLSAKPVAAQVLPQIGTSIAGIGHAQLTSALQSLGLSEEAANAIMESSRLSRPESFKENQEIQKQIGQALGNIALAFG